MKKRTRSEIIYEVALGGIASAMALLLVWLSVVVPYGTIALYICASIALIVPLTQRYYFATISAYIISSLLAFAIVGDILLISGFVVYFAPMTIISGVMAEKKVKWFVLIPVKVVYIGLALAFLYYVAGTIMISEKVISDVPFWAVELVGIVVLLALDYLMGYVYGGIKRKVSAVIRKRVNKDDNDDETESDEGVYDLFDLDDDSLSNEEKGAENTSESTAETIKEKDEIDDAFALDDNDDIKGQENMDNDTKSTL